MPKPKRDNCRWCKRKFMGAAEATTKSGTEVCVRRRTTGADCTGCANLLYKTPSIKLRSEPERVLFEDKLKEPGEQRKWTNKMLMDERSGRGPKVGTIYPKRKLNEISGDEGGDKDAGPSRRRARTHFDAASGNIIPAGGKQDTESIDDEGGGDDAIPSSAAVGDEFAMEHVQQEIVDPADDQPERNGFGESIERQGRIYVQGNTCLGVHWPLWKLKERFGTKKKPPEINNYEYRGVPGVLLDSIHGHPSGTTMIYLTQEDGVSHNKELANGKRLGEVFDALSKDVDVTVKASGKATAEDGAPEVMKLTIEAKETADEEAPISIYDEIWGIGLLSQTKKKVYQQG